MRTAALLHHVRCEGDGNVPCIEDAVVTIPTPGAVKGYCGEHLDCIHSNGNVKISGSNLTNQEVQYILGLSRSPHTRSATTNVH